MFVSDGDEKFYLIDCEAVCVHEEYRKNPTLLEYKEISILCSMKKKQCIQYSNTGTAFFIMAERNTMQFLCFVSDYMIPFLMFYLVGFGLLMKKDIYDEFVKGAKEGFQITYGILPTLIGLMTAVGVLRASGALELLAKVLQPLIQVLHFPSELVPLILVKTVSSSAATSLLLDIFKQYGPDSYLGQLASVICASTETIFYTMSVYFLAAGVKKTRYTLSGALLACFTGIVASVLFVR